MKELLRFLQSTDMTRPLLTSEDRLILEAAAAICERLIDTFLDADEAHFWVEQVLIECGKAETT